MGTISTAIPSPEYQPLLDHFFSDACGIARIGSELAIMTAWAWNGGAGGRFTTPAARVKALIDDGTFSTRVWFDEMHERYPSSPPRYDDTTSWGRALIAATDPGLPNLKQMAECCNITKDQYAFAYRGESGSVHSAARVLAANAAGHCLFQGDDLAGTEAGVPAEEYRREDARVEPPGGDDEGRVLLERVKRHGGERSLDQLEGLDRHRADDPEPPRHAEDLRERGDRRPSPRPRAWSRLRSSGRAPRGRGSQGA